MIAPQAPDNPSPTPPEESAKFVKSMHVRTESTYVGANPWMWPRLEKLQPGHRDLKQEQHRENISGDLGVFVWTLCR